MQEGKYIYCIIKNRDFIDFGPLGIGERGDRVYTIPDRDISAVVSDAPIKRYPVARENLIPHERAIEEGMKSYTVLPVRFATIAGDEVRVKKILEREYDRFMELLNYMDDKKELGLKAIFKEEVIYKDILDNHQEIRLQKEKMPKEPPSAKLHQRLIEIGRLVETALKEEKTKYKEDILCALEPLAMQVKTCNSYAELAIINAAFLVEKERESEFDQEVKNIVDRHGDKIKFKYVGIVPPFNFVNVVINTGDL